VAKPNRTVGVNPLLSAVGSYQDGAVEVVADGIKVHWAKLRIPDKIYEADFAWITLRYGAVSIFFGKEDLDSPDTLRTRLEIRYPAEKFLNQFWKNSREFHERLRQHDNWSAGEGGRDGLVPQRMKALKDHSESANFDFMARSGTEAVADFYYVSPTGVARLAQGMGAGGIRIDPVVRVQLVASELVRLLDAAQPVATQLTSQLPKEFLNDFDPVPRD
jgi:hypothetical protein